MTRTASAVAVGEEGRPGRSATGAAGFSLVELVIALAVLSLGLALAAQLLAESARMLAQVSAEPHGLPAPVALERVRAEVRAATGFAVLPRGPGEDPALLLTGLPAGDVLYSRMGRSLARQVVEPGGDLDDPAPLMSGVVAWQPYSLGPRLLRIDLSYRAPARRRSPLALLPGASGPATVVKQETLMLAPRGAGLGTSW